MSDALEFTGERFVPGVAGEIWYEHWHRYHFAARLVAGRDVLDVACGAGYGSALLARSAAKVTGADISAAAVDHARRRYAGVPNVEFRQADCTALPFADASFDVVVSFETVEHIAAQEAFLDEVRRVLRPGGVVILSCPNKVEYTDQRGTVNEFHVRELYRDELAGLVAPRFPHAAWYGQRASFYSIVWPERDATCAEIFEVSETAAGEPVSGHARPLYFIVIAGASADALAAIAPFLSVLADRDEWIYRDYEKVTRDLDGAHRRGNALEGQLAALQGAYAESVRQCDALRSDLDALHAQSERQRQEVARRAGLRWWATLPFRRVWRSLKGMPPTA
jgi:ubiquinone/menaquinone biosynthesis C-methylase UbiE